MRRVGGAGEVIKFRGLTGIRAGELHGFGVHGQVHAIQLVQGEGLAVGGDGAGAAHVDGTELAAFQEEGAAGFLVIREFHGPGEGHHAADHEAVEVGEMAGDVAGDEEAVDVKSVAELLGVQAGNVLRPGHAADGIFNHDAGIIAKNVPGDKCGESGGGTISVCLFSRLVLRERLQRHGMIVIE